MNACLFYNRCYSICSVAQTQYLIKGKPPHVLAFTKVELIFRHIATHQVVSDIAIVSFIPSVLSTFK